MLVPLSWLQEFVEIDISVHELAELLTCAGLEVEKVDKAKLPFEGIVVGKVLHTEAHPEADRLKVARVSDGEQEFQVVCGDPKCSAGMVTAFAKVGSKLFDDEGKATKIKKGKLRGVESFGMLCSEQELGLAADSYGIINLPETAPLGALVETLFGDTILEIGLTPNLGHCMSLRGVAREVAALTNKPLKQRRYEFSGESEGRTAKRVTVDIEDPDFCSRYSCIAVRGVDVKPSPDWLRRRLEMCNIRSINNIVDATNYVMLETGQPLHAFDLDAIEDGKIVIKPCEEEILHTTLDEVERKIPVHTGMIYDGVKPIAIAGIMGGQNSSVSDTTTDILIEGAAFDAGMVRRASKLLGLRSDASARFERKTDTSHTAEVVKYAAELIADIAGGIVDEEGIDEWVKPAVKREITCRLPAVNRLLGIHLSLGEVKEIFLRLEIEVVREDNETLVVNAPHYRNDLCEEIDLIEEVARIYGYNNIDYKEPKVVISSMETDPRVAIEREMREKLCSAGLTEFLTCDLISEKQASFASPEEFLLHVMHPSSVDQAVLRPSMLPGLLESVKHNAAHGTFDISAFEIGRVHYKERNATVEKPVAAILLSGKRMPHCWDQSSKSDVDFYDLKGIVEGVFEAFGIEDVATEKTSIDLFHPGQQAQMRAGDAPLAVLGQVHPSACKKFAIDRPVFFAQIELLSLLNLWNKTKLMEMLPQFPGSDRDWTVTLEKNKPIETLLSAAKKLPSRLLKKVELLDVYTGEKVAADKKNVTLRFHYGDEAKTVSQERVDKEHERVLSAISEKNS